MDSAKKVGLWDIVLYAVAMNFGIRWLATGAATGPVAIPIWIVAAVFFLVPLSLATMALSETYPGEGAIYAWTRETMGPFAGFLCGWIYWACNLPFFASLIVFTINLAAGVIGGDVAAALKQPLGALAATAAIVIIMAWTHARGIGTGKWISSVGAVVSIVLSLFIIGAGFRLAGIQGSATDFATASYLPKLDANAAVLWATMVFAYGGAEGVALLRNEAKGGARTIVTALIMVGVGLTVAYVLGTMGMLMVLPQAEASALGGLPAALGAAAQKLGVANLTPWLVGALGIVILGGLNAWFGVAARLPFAVGIDNMLPAVVGRRDPKNGAPYVAIWLQAVLVIVITALTQVGVDTLNKLYGLIQAMSTLTYTLPFLFLFAAWWKADTRPWARWTAVFGFLVSLSGVLCSLVPGEGTTVADVLKLAGSGAILVVSGCILYLIYVLRRKAS